MSAFGTLYREMRQGKRFSQMDFALEREVSAKHISFLETGRSKPSKGMVLYLAQMLQTDLAATNRLLSAAGYSQVFSDQDLSAPGMAIIKEAVEHLLQAPSETSPTDCWSSHWLCLTFRKPGKAMLWKIWDTRRFLSP